MKHSLEHTKLFNLFHCKTERSVLIMSFLALKSCALELEYLHLVLCLCVHVIKHLILLCTISPSILQCYSRVTKPRV